MDQPPAALRPRYISSTPLIAATFLLVATIVLAVAGRWTGLGAARIDVPEAVSFIDLTFLDREDGAVVVRAAGRADPPRVIMPGEHGFVRVAVARLARDRRIAEADLSAPFRLGKSADGRFFLHDLATGRVLILAAYGHANAQSFAQLLEPGRMQP